MVLFDYLYFKSNSFFESNTILNAGLKKLNVICNQLQKVFNHFFSFSWLSNKKVSIHFEFSLTIFVFIKQTNHNKTIFISNFVASFWSMFATTTNVKQYKVQQ